MKRNRSIKLKAIFLLVVFTLNTAVTFACAVGLNMGFNRSHHQEELAVKPHGHAGHDESAMLRAENKHKPHGHAPGTKAHRHSHENKDVKINTHDDVSHPHDKVANTDVSGDRDNNCCKDEAAKAARADKLTPKAFNLKIQTGFVALFNIPLNPVFSVSSSIVLANNKYFVQGHHPPIPSIRIAIQSFQI
jgi:hypothetical protein